MRSEEEFEKFISEELKEYACRAEVPARCKAEIDARIIAAESDQKKGGIKQMGNRAVKKRLAAAVICCLLIGTGVFAAGRISTIVSHSSSEPSVTEYEKINELEEEAGFSIRKEESFTNGFVFTSGGIVDTEGQDEEQNVLSSWKEISLTYRNEEGKTLTIDAEQEAAYEQDLGANALDTRTIQGTEAYYNYTEMYLVPPSYKPTAEEEERNRTDPHYNIAYGSDEPETTYFSTLCFAKDGVKYYITTFDDLSADDLYLIGEELLD